MSSYPIATSSSSRLSDKDDDRSRCGDGKEEDRLNHSPGDGEDGELWDQTDHTSKMNKFGEICLQMFAEG